MCRRCKRDKCGNLIVKKETESVRKFENRLYCCKDCYEMDRRNQYFTNRQRNICHPFKSSIK
jgi:hypothetical protein